MESTLKRDASSGTVAREDSALLQMKEEEGTHSLSGKAARRARMVFDVFLSFVPILRWLPQYSIKDNLFNDMVGGFTVGIMHVPQGIAYASLAGVRPVVGLYTSLFAPFFYMFFGTSRHVSLGVFAVVSLMTGACNIRMSDNHFSNIIGNLTETEEVEARLDYAIGVVTALGFLIGLIQISMAILRLDFLISLLSDQVITGFMIGASVHVFIAQMDKVLGVSLPRNSGIGKIFLNVRDIGMATLQGRINVYTTILSVVAISLLFFVKLILDPVVKRCTPLPMPYDLVLLIVGAIMSYLCDLNGWLQIKVIGVIPTGLPGLHLPNFSILPAIIGDALAISIVILVVTISMAKLFAKKHNYHVDVRQEFYALGLMECICSFFPVWPSSTALARTLVYEAAGTKTQLATVFSSALLLCVIFWIGRFLELLPVCLLSCIIIVALQGMFLKLRDIPVLWRSSRTDACIFLTALIATIVLDVIEGLTCGLIMSVLFILIKAKRGRFVTIDEDDMNCVRSQNTSKPFENGDRCFRYDGALFFLNAEEFIEQIKTIAATPTVNVIGQNSEEETRERSGTGEESREDKEMPDESAPPMKRKILVDLSSLLFVDYAGAAQLINSIGVLAKSDIEVEYCNPPAAVLSQLRTYPAFDKHRSKFVLTRNADSSAHQSTALPVQVIP